MDNIRRMNDSAERISLPQIPEDLALAGITELVKLERDWVPHEKDTSLYIRPFMIGLDAALGVHSSHHCQYIVIVCPVGAYYPEGLNPVKIYVEDEDVRAVKGGTGMAKTGGNYAASLRAGDRAEAKGYSQVLWLDGVHRKYIEEVGSMNVMFKVAGKILTPDLNGSVLSGITRRSCIQLLKDWGYEVYIEEVGSMNVMFKVAGKILTPDLNGSVLSGITRRSCIQLLKDWGYEVEERRISAEELFQAAADGTLEEAWGTGTAAVVSPIGELAEGDKKVTVSDNKIGPVTQRLYDELTGIQWGRVADPHSWTMKVC